MDALSPLFLVALFGGFYFLAIRPQKARIKAVQDTQRALSAGQQVMTTAGLYGVVTSVDADDVHLEVSPGVVLRFARGAVAKLVEESADSTSADSAVAVDDEPTSLSPGK